MWKVSCAEVVLGVQLLKGPQHCQQSRVATCYGTRMNTLGKQKLNLIGMTAGWKEAEAHNRMETMKTSHYLVSSKWQFQIVFQILSTASHCHPSLILLTLNFSPALRLLLFPLSSLACLVYSIGSSLYSLRVVLFCFC